LIDKEIGVYLINLENSDAILFEENTSLNKRFYKHIEIICNLCLVWNWIDL